MNQFLFKLINWYIKHFPFPHRGWKYFSAFIRKLKLDKKVYQKKIGTDLFINVNVYDHIQQQLFWYGRYDEDVSGFFQNVITENSIVVDAGGNIGYFTLLAARKAAKGTVYTFEPVEFLYQQLEENLKLNKLTNVYPVQKALTRSEGSTTIYESSRDNTGMNSLQKPENYTGKFEKIDCISLDIFFGEYKELKPMVVKIDTEGAEMEILKGMTNCLQHFKPLLIIEILNEHLNRFESSAEMIFDFLAGYNYDAWTIIDSNTLKKANGAEESNGTVFSPRGYVFASHIKLLN